MAPFSFVPNRAWGMGSVALGAIPHEMRLRKRQCSARYTKADALEEAVFKDLRSTLEHPEIVLAEVRRMKSRGSNPHIDTELRRIDAQARQLRIWEQRMVRLYGFGEIDDDYILRETRKAKAKMQELDRERERLLMQKQEIDNLDAAENAATEYCRRVSDKLGHLGHEEKRLLLEALQVKVVVGPDRIEIQGAIPSYATIAQTSAYRLCCTYDYPSTEPVLTILPQLTATHNKHAQE